MAARVRMSHFSALEATVLLLRVFFYTNDTQNDNDCQMRSTDYKRPSIWIRCRCCGAFIWGGGQAGPRGRASRRFLTHERLRDERRASTPPRAAPGCAHTRPAHRPWASPPHTNYWAGPRPKERVGGAHMIFLQATGAAETAYFAHCARSGACV